MTMQLLERRALRLSGALAAGISVLLVLVWALTPHSNFWPQNVIVPLALLVGVHAWFVVLDGRPGIRRRLGDNRRLAAHVSIAAALGLYLVAIWAQTPGYFWPAWALLGLGATVAVHAATALPRRVQ
jgi:hypothetical protein